MRYSESLTALDPAILATPPADPAKADSAIHYRRTESGFLLWSVGDDRKDDGGTPDKDWLWRHESR